MSSCIELAMRYWSADTLFLQVSVDHNVDAQYQSYAAKILALNIGSTCLSRVHLSMIYCLWKVIC